MAVSLGLKVKKIVSSKAICIVVT